MRLRIGRNQFGFHDIIKKPCNTLCCKVFLYLSKPFRRLKRSILDGGQVKNAANPVWLGEAFSAVRCQNTKFQVGLSLWEDA